MKRFLMRRVARAVQGGGGGGGASMIAALSAGLWLGSDGSFANWDPVSFADAMWQASEFTAFADNGEGPRVAADANGWPLSSSWSIKFFQNQNRPNQWAIPQGVWKLRAVERGAPGTWSLGFATGVVMSNFVRTGNVVTADVTISSSEAVLTVRCTEPITDLKLVAPGYDVLNPPVWRTEALEFARRLVAFRGLGMMGLNTTEFDTAASWATREPDMKHWGMRGWGAFCKAFTEIHNAPGSQCKFIAFNTMYRWQHADYLPWLTYVKSQIPATAGVLCAGINETWNSLYPHFGYFYAQSVQLANSPTTSEPVWQIPTIDYDRINYKTSTAAVAITTGAAAAGATTVTIAPGGSGSLVQGEDVQFANHASRYTIAGNGGIANVAAGGTLTLTSPLDIAVPSGTTLVPHALRWGLYGRWWALREARIAKALKDVFGAEFGTRAFFVAEGHVVNASWHTDRYLPFAARAEQVAEFGAVDSWVHAVGGAPYPTLSPTQIVNLTSAQQAIDLLRNGGYVSLAVLGPALDTWNALRTQYSIPWHICYEIGMEHMGFVPAEPWMPGYVSGGWYLNPFIIQAIRSPDFLTYSTEFLDLLELKQVKIAQALYAFPSTHIPPSSAGVNTGLPNTHWGWIDQAIAANAGVAWSWDTGSKAAAAKAQMISTGQWV